MIKINIALKSISTNEKYIQELKLKAKTVNNPNFKMFVIDEIVYWLNSKNPYTEIEIYKNDVFKLKKQDILNYAKNNNTDIETSKTIVTKQYLDKLCDFEKYLE